MTDTRPYRILVTGSRDWTDTDTVWLGLGDTVGAIHRDAITIGERVLIVDDLLATGGTAAATVHLVRQLGGEIMGLVVLVELESLKGRDKLNGCEVHSVITYS